MKVWWCEEHLCGNLPNRDTEGWASVPGQSGVCFFAEEFGSETNCRMVEMQLVPADARMVSGLSDLPPEVFAAASWEIQQIVFGAVLARTEVDSRLAGHWAGRILGAAFGTLVPDSTKTEPPKDPWDYDP